MNVLFVTYDFPFPTNTGGKNRAYHLIKEVAKEANIFLYSYVRDDFSPDYISEMTAVGVKEIKVYKRKKLSNLLNFPKTVFKNTSIFKTLYYEKEVLHDLQEMILENDIDIVHFESAYTGFFIGESMKKRYVAQVLGTENIEYQLYFDYARIANPVLRPFLMYQANRLKNEETKMYKKADFVTVITKEEANEISKYTNEKCEVVTNGIDPGKFPYELSKKINNNILFVGNFSYFPNIDAVNFFYNEVFKKLDKNLTLTIVGKKCKEIFHFEDEKVIFKEFVENIIDEYRNADALVFPIRVGGGTNFKILEAMALGIPIIANPERLSGLDAVADLHFLEAKEANDYVRQIKRLYNEPETVKNITENARKIIEESYSWHSIGKKLMEVWKKAYK